MVSYNMVYLSSANGLTQHQAIVWTNIALLSTGPWEQILGEPESQCKHFHWKNE